jgi:hypothetical protein
VRGTVSIPCSRAYRYRIPDSDSIRSQRAVGQCEIDLIRKYHGNGEALAEFRKRLYGNASDEEIIHPVKKHDGKFDLSTAVPADEAQALDAQYQARLTNLGDGSKFKAVAFGFLAWALPVIAIYLLGIAVHWVYVGFRSKSV